LILKLAASEHEHLLNNMIDIQCVHARFGSLHQRADASENIGCRLSIFDHGPDRPARVINIRDRIGQPAQAGLGVGHHCRNGLGNLMRDGRSQSAHSGQALDPRKLSLGYAEFAGTIDYTLFQFLI
jgi:hypothetical protein